MNHTDNNSWINGLPAVAFSIADRGLAYGHGVFETMLVCRGCIPFLDRHIARAINGAKALGIEVDEPRLRQYVERGLEYHQSLQKLAGDEAMIIKVMITAGESQRGYKPSTDSAPNYIVQSFDYVLSAKSSGMRLYSCQGRLPHQPVLAGIKHLNRLDQVLAATEFSLDDYDDGLMLDTAGNVVETVSRNLFAKVDGRWLTPDLTLCGVAGVMRDYLLGKLFAEAGIEVSVVTLPLASLLAADEVFVCNSIAGIVAVQSLGDDADWSQGADTLQLKKLLKEVCACWS